MTALVVPAAIALIPVVVDPVMTRPFVDVASLHPYVAMTRPVPVTRRPNVAMALMWYHFDAWGRWCDVDIDVRACAADARHQTGAYADRGAKQCSLDSHVASLSFHP